MAKENKKSLNAEVTDELLESASGGMYESRNGCCVMGICPLCGGENTNSNPSSCKSCYGKGRNSDQCYDRCD